MSTLNHQSAVLAQNLAEAADVLHLDVVTLPHCIPQNFITGDTDITVHLKI